MINKPQENSCILKFSQSIPRFWIMLFVTGKFRGFEMVDTLIYVSLKEFVYIKKN